jgi:polysaccharide deacetylase family protein (PEP-CTERM system associated)
MNIVSNILTVDLEDWFVVENLKGNVDQTDWPKLKHRIEENTIALLQIFRQHGVHATFFVLGWMAEHYPHLIGELTYSGHEIACHSYAHHRVDMLDKDKFREDTQRAMEVILRTSGHQPLGYRAPSWSINSRVPWAWEVLADLGFKYDSSVYPIKHDIYGEPDAPRDIYRLSLESGRTLYELPASTVRLAGRNMPIGGGGYLRLSPYWYTSSMIRKQNAKGRPVMVYIHPWEIDVEQPRIEGLTPFQKYRQYGSLSTMARKLHRLLSEFDFMTALDYVNVSTRKPIGFEN